MKVFLKKYGIWLLVFFLVTAIILFFVLRKPAPPPEPQGEDPMIRREKRIHQGMYRHYQKMQADAEKDGTVTDQEKIAIDKHRDKIIKRFGELEIPLEPTPTPPDEFLE